MNDQCPATNLSPLKAGRIMARAFTLIELLTACAILALIIVSMTTILNKVSDIWISGRAKMSALQQGRAVLDFFARDMRNLKGPQTMAPSPSALPSAASSPQSLPKSWLQLVQGASMSTYPSNAVSVTNSSNLFGQAVGDQTTQGNLWILGYFLAEDSASKERTLYRLAVPPDAAATVYQVFSSTVGADARTASWVNVPQMFSNPIYTQPLASHMAAFYLTCLDAAGRPIPWLSSSSTANGDPAAAPLKFNSAARFIMPAGPAASAAVLNGGKTFTYLSSAGLQAHQLPAAIRIDFVAMDDSYLKRKLTLPPPPALDDPVNFGNASYESAERKAQKYVETLYQAGVRTARLFSLTIPLTNGP